MLFTGFQFLLPTVPPYAADLGAGKTAVGIVVGTMPVLAILVRPFVGVALDRLGRRGPLLFGLAVHGLAMGLYALAPSLGGLTGLVAARALQGIGWGTASTAFGTLAADLVPAERRGEGIGYFGLSSALGMAVGPAIGDWLYARGPNILFAGAFAFTALAFLLMLPPLPKSPLGREPSKAKRTLLSRGWTGLLSASFEPASLWPALLAGLMTITYGGIVGFLPLFGREVGVAAAGLFFSVNAVVTFLVRLVAGRAFDRRGYPVVALAALSGTAGLLLLAEARTLSDFLLAAAFYGVAFGVIQPALQAWAVHLSTPERRGAANAMFYSAFDLGIGTGAALCGPIATSAGYRAMYRWLAWVFALFLVLGAVAPRPHLTEGPDPQQTSPRERVRRRR
ncbi:MAG TPA: MFS transporter [Bacillaceae bacterium]|nr:MFS transporter [Bacillaceae bacterium]